ncbi:MAG: hypothetical protein M1814_005350 [Vezdaea aestivalis]|nr:MAG: hypothetical protein M1814_005350 [Vezdaea aestivalis]
MPDGLYHQLWDIYSSDKGYELYSDAEKLINLARKAREPPTRSNCLPQWHDVILGVLSNSDPRVNKVLKALGVKSKARYVKDETTSRRFPKVVEWEVIKFFSLSCYLGIGKPDPKVFRRTGDYVTKNFLSHMNSEDIVFAHIGDNYAKDGKGAFDAGWNGIYLNRNHAANRADVPPSTDMISRHEVKDDMQTSAIFEINNLEALLLNGKGEPAEHLTQAFAPLRKLLND